MLFDLFRSERAIQMNITIMRALVRLREKITSHKDPADRLAKVEADLAIILQFLR